ncbi:MAG: site-2 protease family protein [Actinomycetota bacterium]
MSGLFDAILGLGVLLVSIVIHETSHAVAALALGDDTARKAGRITPNPIKHLDLVGSVVMPAALFFSTGTMFGYAKPVPVTVSKLRGTDRTGFALVAAAGPASNLVLAVIFAFLVKQFYGFDLSGVRQIGRPPGSEIIGVGPYILLVGFVWNMVLAAFNLLPIPPLDGSRFLRVLLSQPARATLDRIEPFGFLILFVLLIWLSEPLFRVVGFIESALLRILPI